jgi:hypothetical protein
MDFKAVPILHGHLSQCSGTRSHQHSAAEPTGGVVERPCGTNKELKWVLGR